MKRFKNIFFYVAVIGGFSVLIYRILLSGVKLEQGRNIVIPETKGSHWKIS